jgi:hypothetical protein
MSIPESPVDMREYNATLADYSISAAAFDSAMGVRDEAFGALAAAQDAFDVADKEAEQAAKTASIDFGNHVAAAKEVGVEPVVKEPKRKARG